MLRPWASYRRRRRRKQMLQIINGMHSFVSQTDGGITIDQAAGGIWQTKLPHRLAAIPNDKHCGRHSQSGYTTRVVNKTWKLAKNVFFFFFFLTGAQAEDLSHCYRKEATQQMTSFLPAHGSSSSTTFLHFMSHITSSSGRCIVSANPPARSFQSHVGAGFGPN